jgi:hypothetical protein
MGNKTVWKALMIIVPIAGLAFVLANWEKIRKKMAGDSAAPGTTTPGNNTGTVGGGTAQLNYDKLLKEGVRGEEVKVLQGLMNQYHGTSLELDGIFGPLTKSALQSWIGKDSTTLNEISGN